VAQILAPYYLPQDFAPLRGYESRGLSALSWAEDQFALEVVVARSTGSDFDARCKQVLSAIDGLPLQVKDLLRGTIHRIRVGGTEDFALGTLGTWSKGEIRVNADWALLSPLRRPAIRPRYARHLLQATFLHECGHALVEDPRGGIPMGNVLSLLAASGWLPHPSADPIPFRDPAASVDALSAHYLRRLQLIDGAWDPERPLGSSGTPLASQFDRDLMDQPPDAFSVPRGGRGSVGLRAPTKLARDLMDAASEGRLEQELGAIDLDLGKVRAALSRYRPVSPYAEEVISETPAEIFHWLHVASPKGRAASPALALGERVLVGPWRQAELELGPRRTARLPARAIATAQLGR
jgi:hypothetical protein